MFALLQRALFGAQETVMVELGSGVVEETRVTWRNLE
jgi:hypothetical protein